VLCPTVGAETRIATVVAVAVAVIALGGTLPDPHPFASALNQSVLQGGAFPGSDECAMYFVNFSLDIAIGTFMIWCFVRVQEVTAVRFGVDSLKVRCVVVRFLPRSKI